MLIETEAVRIARERMRRADNAFSAELERLFGEDAGEARWDHRGESTPQLRSLQIGYLEAAEGWRVALAEDRLERFVSARMYA